MDEHEDEAHHMHPSPSLLLVALVACLGRCPSIAVRGPAREVRCTLGIHVRSICHSRSFDYTLKRWAMNTRQHCSWSAVLSKADKSGGEHVSVQYVAASTSGRDLASLATYATSC
jgi:hypothetical protein